MFKDQVNSEYLLKAKFIYLRDPLSKIQSEIPFKNLMAVQHGNFS